MKADRRTNRLINYTIRMLQLSSFVADWGFCGFLFCWLFGSTNLPQFAYTYRFWFRNFVWVFVLILLLFFVVYWRLVWSMQDLASNGLWFVAMKKFMFFGWLWMRVILDFIELHFISIQCDLVKMLIILKHIGQLDRLKTCFCQLSRLRYLLVAKFSLNYPRMAILGEMAPKFLLNYVSLVILKEIAPKIFGWQYYKKRRPNVH